MEAFRSLLTGRPSLFVCFGIPGGPLVRQTVLRMAFTPRLVDEVVNLLVQDIWRFEYISWVGAIHNEGCLMFYL